MAGRFLRGTAARSLGSTGQFMSGATKTAGSASKMSRVLNPMKNSSKAVSSLAKGSKFLKVAGKAAGPLAFLGVGLDAYSNFTNDNLSTGEAAMKTLDQNKFMALGAGIGSIVPGVGTLLGAAIGGIADLVFSNDDEEKEQRKEAERKKRMERQDQIFEQMASFQVEFAKPKGVYIDGNRAGTYIASNSSNMG